MFEIKKQVPKPEGMTTRHSTLMKYPFAEMSPGDSFFVPKSEMLEGDTPQAFRVRVQKSSGNWARRVVEEREKRETFTVVIMEENHQPEEGEEQLYKAGDIGVWMN